MKDLEQLMNPLNKKRPRF